MNKLFIIVLLSLSGVCFANQNENAFVQGFADGLNKSITARQGYSPAQAQKEESAHWYPVNDYGQQANHWHTTKSMCMTDVHNSGNYYVDCILVKE